MGMPRWMVAALVVSGAAVAAGAALAVGPWPGLAPSVSLPSGDVRYTATRAGGMTTVKAIRAGTVIASTRSR